MNQQSHVGIQVFYKTLSSYYNKARRELHPVTITIKKLNRISFFGHLIRSPVSRIRRKIMEKLWNSKTNINWLIEIKEDMKELQIAIEDLKGKTEKLHILKDKCITIKSNLKNQKKGSDFR